MDEKTIIGIAGALLGAVTTYLVAVLKLRRELEYKYDTDLRDKRIPLYLELWKLLEDLAKYARPKQLTFDDLYKLTASLGSGISSRVVSFYRKRAGIGISP